MPSMKYKNENGEWLPIAGKAGVEAFNGRAGAVKPASGDYTAEMVGAAPAVHTHTPDQVGDVNPNLLHNWYFANPVNQRGGWVVPSGVKYFKTDWSAEVGTTDKYYPVKRFVQRTNLDAIFEIDGVEYIVAYDVPLRGYVGYRYTIDRWFKHESGTIFVNDDSISVNDSLFRQIIENGIENICGKTCCFSVLTKDGELVTGFGSIPSNGGREFYRTNNVVLYTYADGNSVSVVIETQNGKTLQPVAAKLEFGSTQTLAHQDENGNWVLNEIPDYNEELLKCCMSTADSSDTYANNYKTPAAVGAVNKAGDTMTGPLGILHDGVATVLDVDGGSKCSYWRVAYDSKWSQLIFNESMLQYALTLDSGLTWAVHNILHTGNKPSGSYTGNGTAQTVATGGIGHAVMIYSERGCCILSPGGGIGRNGTNILALSDMMSDGSINIVSANSLVNENGIVYFYQVL